MKKILLSVLLCCLFFALPTFSSAQSYETLPAQTNVPVNKTFTITLNHKVDIHSLNESSIYVKDQQNRVVEGVSIALDNASQKKIIVQAPIDGYKPNSQYTLYIEKAVESQKGKVLKASTMTFTTSNEKTATYELRPNSVNDVVYKEDVVVLTEAQMNTLVEGDADDQHFMFQDIHTTEIAQLQSGDILIFPPTEDAPNGFAKKISSLAAYNGVLEIHTTEPTFQEVVKDLDISKEVAITTDDFQVSDAVKQRPVASIVTTENRKHVFENPDGTEAKIEFKDKKDAKGIVVGTNIVFTNFKFNVLQNGVYFPFDGTISFTKPTITLDASKNNAEYLQFTAGLLLDLEQSMKLGKFSKDNPVRAELPIQIPVKFAGTVGVVIIPYLEIGVSGEITFGYTVGFESFVDAGIEKTDDGLKTYNRSSLNPIGKFATISGSINGKIALGTAIQLEVLQFELAGLEAALYANMKLEGELAPNNVCYSIHATAGVYIGGYLGDHTDAAGRLKFVDHVKDLASITKCEMMDIDAENLSIRAGDSKPVKVTTTNLKGKEQAIEFPNKSVTFSSNNEDVTVSSNGRVEASEYAKAGETATITVTYNNTVSYDLKKDITVTILERDASKPLETPNLEEVTPEPENKTYTIKEWNLSFDLLEDVGNYEISKVYDDYHILKNGVPMVYLIRYEKDYDPSFRGYWDVLGTRGNYTYYIRSGFNIFTDDENSPHFDEQADTFNSIVKSKQFLK